MSLFSPDDIRQPGPAASTSSEQFPSAVEASGETRHIIGTRGLGLEKALAALKPDVHLHLTSYAQWSSWEVLRALVRITGPVMLYMTSWSIAENPVRQLIKMIDEGSITETTLILHERTPVNHPAAWQLASQRIKRIRLTKVHAKNLVLINDTWGISVVTTANFNRNKNIEKYVICTHRHIALDDANLITEVYEKRSPFIS